MLTRPGRAPASGDPYTSVLTRALRRMLPRRVLLRVRGEQSTEELVAGGLRLGHGAFIARRAYIDPGFLWLIEIGERAIIAPGVEIIAHDASTKHLIGKSIIQRVKIGRRVYIGSGAIVLPGVTIGDDAIIGSASVVRSDVPAGMVAVGVPARVVSTTEEYRARHQELLATRPSWGREATVRGGISRALMDEMYDALADGPGYVD